MAVDTLLALLDSARRELFPLLPLRLESASVLSPLLPLQLESASVLLPDLLRIMIPLLPTLRLESASLTPKSKLRVVCAAILSAVLRGVECYRFLMSLPLPSPMAVTHPPL